MAERNWDRTKDTVLAISVLLGPNADAKYTAYQDSVIRQVTVYNQGGSTLTSAVVVDNAGSTVCTSSLLAAGGDPEEQTLANTSFSDDTVLTITGGDQPCFVCVLIGSDFGS